MTDYVAKLAELTSPTQVAARVKAGRALLAKYGPWIRKYRGGLPAGILAAVMELESGGNPTAVGDPSLGEYGFYQVTKYTPTEVGLPAEARFDPETNVFLGSLNYQEEACRMAAHYPSLVVKGSEDQWKLARLAFAIGAGGARTLVANAVASGKVSRGRVFAGIRAMVDGGGSVAVSASQSADKVWYRVHIVDYNFMVGQKVAFGLFGPPQVIPAPPKYPRYTFPKDLAPYTGRPNASGLVTVAALAALAVIIARVT
jgi:hypothetical protein